MHLVPWCTGLSNVAKFELKNGTQLHVTMIQLYCIRNNERSNINKTWTMHEAD